MCCRVPQDSIWIKQETYLESRFGSTDRSVGLIFEAKAGGNVLTEASIREMFLLQDSIYSVTTDEDGTSYRFQNGICWLSASGACRTEGILKYFSDNATEFENVAAQGSAALMQALSAESYPDGTVATAEQNFGGAERDADGVLTSAKSATWVRARPPQHLSPLTEHNSPGTSHLSDHAILPQTPLAK